MRRREFMTTAAGGIAGLLVGCERSESRERAVEVIDGLPGRADVELTLRAAPDRLALLDGDPTEVWRFSADLARGRGALEPGAGYLGPTLRLRRGQRIRVRLENGIDDGTIVHWHGLYVPAEDDGHPVHAIGKGQRYEYDFEIGNRAGTYWYHPHPADRTGPQIYAGLAGLLLVTDDEEQRLGLPDGDRELAVVLQDRTFDRGNQLVYAFDPMIGFLGDRILVNGGVAKTVDVARGPHRLRILNASNSRIYDLAWSDGSPLVVLGTDGGLLDAPRERPHVALGPGQRLDVWANFGDRPGADVWLVSRAFTGVETMMGMGMGMGRGRMMGRRRPSLSNGAPLQLQRFVATRPGAFGRPPDRLAAAPGPAESKVINLGRPRTFVTSMRMMRWRINGRSFSMRAVAPDERVRLNTVEDWELVNPAGHMAMAHPIHLHGRQFRIVERRHGPGARSLRDGLLDEGWHDTFLLLPGDRVRLRVDFPEHTGLFLYHCHNLEHEDMGMMRNYRVEA